MFPAKSHDIHYRRKLNIYQIRGSIHCLADSDSRNPEEPKPDEPADGEDAQPEMAEEVAPEMPEEAEVQAHSATLHLQSSLTAETRPDRST